MSELNFDIRGNLSQGINVMSLDEFRQVFSKNFDETNRKSLLRCFELYAEDLTALMEFDFYIWVGGSYVSKKTSPNDIDFVTIVDFRDYIKNEKEIERSFSSKHARAIYGVDAYVVSEYPEGHKKHSFTKSDLIYWMHLFSSTKPDRAKQKFTKGFVQINFKHHG